MKNKEEIVMNALSEYNQMIKEATKIKEKRSFAYGLIKYLKEEKEPRLILLQGLRGTGKTTALLQQANIKGTYFSCDFLKANMLDMRDLIEALDRLNIEKIGINKEYVLLLDEISYIDNWDIKLKSLIDRRKKLKIVATSSSSLSLQTHEFVRRAKWITVHPLSFSEYINLRYNIKIPTKLSKKIISKVGKNIQSEYLEVLSYLKGKDLLGLYNEYLQQDMPFSLDRIRSEYMDELDGLIKRIIYEDFSKHAKLSSDLLVKSEQLIHYISSIPADGIKLSKISQLLSISKESVSKILNLFETSLVIKGINYQGRNRALKKPKKWFFLSPSIRYSLSRFIANKPELIGNMREDSVFLHLNILYKKIFYSHEADFVLNKLKLEIGGKKKKRSNVVILDTSGRVNENIIPIPLFLLSVPAEENA